MRPLKPSSPYGLSSTTATPYSRADLEHLGAPLDGQRDAGRVVEVRDRVQELRRDALRRERAQRVAQQLGDQPVLVHRDVHDPGLVRGEAAERADVGRTLGEHDVAGVAVDAGDEVERHLRADGDDDVVRVGPDALERPSPRRSARAAAGRALRGAVLQRDLPVAGDEIGDLDGQRVAAAARRGWACRRRARPPRAGSPRRTAPGSPMRSCLPCAPRTARLPGPRVTSVGRSGRTGCGSDTLSSRAWMGGRDDPIECNQDGGTSCPSSWLRRRSQHTGCRIGAVSIYRRGSARMAPASARRLRAIGRRRLLVVLAHGAAHAGQYGRSAQTVSSLRVLGAVGAPRRAGRRVRLHRAGEGGLGLRGPARVGLVRPGRPHGRRAGRLRDLRPARRRCRAPRRCPPARSAPTRCC